MIQVALQLGLLFRSSSFCSAHLLHCCPCKDIPDLTLQARGAGPASVALLELHGRALKHEIWKRFQLASKLVHHIAAECYPACIDGGCLQMHCIPPRALTRCFFHAWAQVEQTNILPCPHCAGGEPHPLHSSPPKGTHDRLPSCQIRQPPPAAHSPLSRLVVRMYTPRGAPHGPPQPGYRIPLRSPAVGAEWTCVKNDPAGSWECYDSIQGAKVAAAAAGSFSQ